MSLILISLILLLPIIVVIIKLKRNSRDYNYPPSPPKFPVIGNLHQLGSLLHRSLHNLSEKYGKIMLLRLGQAPTLVVSSKEAAQEMLKTYDHVFASRPSLKAMRIILYENRDIVFAPYGDYWKQIRKICVVHLLNAKMVQNFRTVRQQGVASMVNNISEMSLLSKVINMSQLMNVFANSILCKAISSKYFVEEESCYNICKLIEEISVITGKFCFGDFIPSLGWLDVISGYEARAKRTFKKWDAVLDEIIQVHQNNLKENEDESHEPNKPDFVDVLLSLQRDEDADFAISKETIKAILMDMVGAGTETTFLILDWGMAELIRNPKIMQKLQNEVREIAHDKSTIEEEDLSKMAYLKAVIKEVLRLHPPVPLLIPRESMESCKLKGYEIPKKTRVLVNVWAINRDPELWENPEEFKPERFLNCSIDYKGHDFEFIPFGAGRRICPGMQFAISTLEVAFANLVNKFDWNLPDGMDIENMDMTDSPGLSIRRRQPLHLVAKPFKF